MLLEVTDFSGSATTIDLTKILYLQEFDHVQVEKLATNPNFQDPTSLAVAQNVQGNPDILKGRTTITFIGGTALLVREDRLSIRDKWLGMMTAGTDLLASTLRKDKL